MKPELEKLCGDFVADRDVVKQVFKREDNAVYAVCANIFCACGHMADAERLKACRRIMEERTARNAKFRKKLFPVLCCLLAVSDDPDERMTLAAGCYDRLKKEFRDSEYLALAAFLLAGLEGTDAIEEKATRGRDIFRLMDRDHPRLTDSMDSVFAMALAYSEKTDEEAAGEVEACYRALKAGFSGGDAQTAAQVLAMGAGAPEEKARRLIDLHHALTEAGVRYGSSGELPPLAALSLADVPVAVLAEEIRDADEFLKGQKGYGSGKGVREQRAMHAAMIVSDQYAGTGMVNSSAMTGALNMLIAKQAALVMSLVMNVVEAALQILAEAKKPAEPATEQTAEAGGDGEQTAEAGGDGTGAE